MFSMFLPLKPIDVTSSKAVKKAIRARYFRWHKVNDHDLETLVLAAYDYNLRIQCSFDYQGRSLTRLNQ